MKLFFDTSALIKRYIDEKGSKQIEELFAEVDAIYVSSITLIECISTIKRLVTEKILSPDDYHIVKNEIENDFPYFLIIPFTGEVSAEACRLIDLYQLKTLDSIQCASAFIVKDEVDGFVSYDKRLIVVGKNEKLNILSPG